MFWFFLSAILCEYYCLNIIASIDFSCTLAFLWMLLQNTTIETGINGRGHEIFFGKSYWATKYLAVWSHGQQNIFWKICKTLQPPLLHSQCTLPKITFQLKVPTRRCFEKNSFEKLTKIHNKKPVQETLFNEAAILQSATLLKKVFKHRCLSNVS